MIFFWYHFLMHISHCVLLYIIFLKNSFLIYNMLVFSYVKSRERKGIRILWSSLEIASLLVWPINPKSALMGKSDCAARKAIVGFFSLDTFGLMRRPKIWKLEISFQKVFDMKERSLMYYERISNKWMNAFLKRNHVFRETQKNTKQWIVKNWLFYCHYMLCMGFPLNK